ncbi:MAG: RHS repeat protein [Bacteroidales bacterium]|nr:RHS repeat protein [Bacteroidales bacterium]
MNIIYNDSRELKQVVTDGNGFSTTFTYDALGQLTKSIDPEGFATSYTYNMR